MNRIVAVLLLMALAASSRADSTPTVIAIVNDEPITSLDLDAALMEMHRTSDMRRESLDGTEILDKVIHDRLLLQEAVAMGLSEDPTVLNPLDERREMAAIKAYARATFTFDDHVDDGTIREYFETYYRKIHLHQLSTRSDAELSTLVTQLRAGASWDSLARIHSVDEHKYRGGQHNFKIWLDVEIPIRNASVDLPLGEISEPFAYYDMVSIIRVDERRPADEAELAAVEEPIRRYFQSEKRKEAWNAYVDEHRKRTPVAFVPEVEARIYADSSIVVRGEFLKISADPALVLNEDHMVSETDLRRAVAHTVMSGGGSFVASLRSVIDEKSRNLVLGVAARASGHFDDPEVVARYRKDLDIALIEAYLQEAVVSQIAFNRDEFQAFYDKNRETFQDAPEVQLATLMVEDEDVAREMSKRLQEGADFGFIKEQYIGADSEEQQSEPRWASEVSFSDSIREQLDAMEVGESSAPISVGHGWLVFKLAGRRAGAEKSIDDVEPQIRQIMFQRKFREKTDELLELLKERSEITLHEDAIATYFNPGS